MKKITYIFGIILVIAILGWFATINPRLIKAQNYLDKGNGFFDQSDFNEAIIQYSKAIILRPTWSQPHIQKAKAYYYLNEKDKADFELQKAIAEDDSGLDAYLNLAQVYLLENESDKAQRTLEKAAAVNPNSTKVYILLAKAQLINQSPQKAEEEIKKAKNKAEDHNLAQYYSAVIALWNQEEAENIDFINPVLKPASLSQQSLIKDWLIQKDINNLKYVATRSKEIASILAKKVLLGEALNQAEEPNLGQILLKEVVQKDENYRDGWLYLGHSYLLLQNYDEAQKALDKAAALDPIYPQTYRLLGQVYEAKGEDVKAKEAYERADQLEGK